MVFRFSSKAGSDALLVWCDVLKDKFTALYTARVTGVDKSIMKNLSVNSGVLDKINTGGVSFEVKPGGD
ncbi:MAG: hypothetical protein ACI9S8_001451 [Chlamydiales bacterium]|jgi:hypothetical protein